MGEFKGKSKYLTMSYVTLRKVIGWLGITLPFICFLGGRAWGGIKYETTLSGYYYTNMQDVFIGVLVCMSLFLMTYRGYNNKDHWTTSFAGFAGLGVALFPTNCVGNGNLPVGVFHLMSSTSNQVHVIFATAFFVLLACVSMFLFTKTDEYNETTPRKIIRNRIYMGCGIGILSIIAVMFGSTFVLDQDFIRTSPYFLIMESLMLVVFGFSWIVKGETLLADPR